ncbi:hypothetical protein BGX29_011127, partial [Mortierella sp. GBA35]
ESAAVLEIESDSKALFSVAYSPDGSQIASGGDDGSIHLWKAETGEFCFTSTGHKGHALDIAFSPDGHQTASCGEDSMIRFVAFSPTGHQIVSGSFDNTVRTWDKATGESGFILEGHAHPINGVAYSSSGHQIASCSNDETVRLWCSQTGEQRKVLDCVPLPEALRQVLYSPYGHCLASNMDSGMQCWDVESGQAVGRLEEIDVLVQDCSFSPDGEIFAISNRDGLRLWDYGLGKWLNVCGSKIGDTERIRGIQGPDCMCLATVTDGLSRVWNLVERDNTYRLQLVWGTGLKSLTMVDASMDGAVGLSPTDLDLMKQRGAIVSGGPDNTRCWNPESGLPVRRLDGIDVNVRDCSFLPAGSRLLSISGDDRRLQLWEIESGKWLNVLGSLIGLSWGLKWIQSPDCLYLASATDGLLRVWKLVERGNAYGLQSVWDTGRNELNLTDINKEGIVGLSDINLELMKQRGASTNEIDEDETDG